MIRLTSYDDGKAIYVPVDVVVKENYKLEFGLKNGLPTTERIPIDGAMVVYDGQEYSVKESPEEVARKVLEWRLAMERYASMANAWAIESDPDIAGAHRYDMEEIEYALKKLAGLDK